MIRTAVERWGCDEYCNASEGASLGEIAASQSRWGQLQAPNRRSVNKVLLGLKQYAATKQLFS
jgi:hypothetical protein